MKDNEYPYFHPTDIAQKEIEVAKRIIDNRDIPDMRIAAILALAKNEVIEEIITNRGLAK